MQHPAISIRQQVIEFLGNLSISDNIKVQFSKTGLAPTVVAFLKSDHEGILAATNRLITSLAMNGLACTFLLWLGLGRGTGWLLLFYLIPLTSLSNIW